ncbi:MAG: ABC transporter permease, partial [Hungatella sp.]
KYAQIINSLLSNQLMLVMVAAFAISILVVFLIRNLSIDYAWMFAIIAGTVTQLGVIFIGDFVFNVSVPMVQLILGAVLSVLLAGVYDFMFFSVDYSRTEYTQFEDDDYYYYVKAVPKLTVSAPDVKVQKISIKKSSKGTKTL